MKTENYIETHSHLDVIGTLWCGRDAEHSYPLSGLTHPKTMAEAKRIAGDFSDLETAEVVTVTREVKETVEVVDLCACRDIATA